MVTSEPQKGNIGLRLTTCVKHIPKHKFWHLGLFGDSCFTMATMVLLQRACRVALTIKIEREWAWNILAVILDWARFVINPHVALTVVLICSQLQASKPSPGYACDHLTVSGVLLSCLQTSFNSCKWKAALWNSFDLTLLGCIPLGNISYSKTVRKFNLTRL